MSSPLKQPLLGKAAKDVPAQEGVPAYHLIVEEDAVRNDETFVEDAIHQQSRHASQVGGGAPLLGSSGGQQQAAGAHHHHHDPYYPGEPQDTFWSTTLNLTKVILGAGMMVRRLGRREGAGTWGGGVRDHPACAGRWGAEGHKGPGMQAGAGRLEWSGTSSMRLARPALGARPPPCVRLESNWPRPSHGAATWGVAIITR